MRRPNRVNARAVATPASFDLRPIALPCSAARVHGESLEPALEAASSVGGLSTMVAGSAAEVAAARSSPAGDSALPESTGSSVAGASSLGRRRVSRGDAADGRGCGAGSVLDATSGTPTGATDRTCAGAVRSDSIGIARTLASTSGRPAAPRATATNAQPTATATPRDQISGMTRRSDTILRIRWRRSFAGRSAGAASIARRSGRTAASFTRHSA